MANKWNHGRWAATFIQNTETGKYHCTINTENAGFIDFWDEYDWISLCNEIRISTGICMLKRKDMHFEKLSDFERIATIDATQTRDDCRVSLDEIRQGWKPNLPYSWVMGVME